MSRGWYVVRTKSEYEKKVKGALEKTIQTLGLNNKIFQVIVPSEEVIEYRQNKKYVKERPYFTGYVFLDMELEQETYWAVRNTPGVAGFLGGTQPTSLADEEVKNLFELIERPAQVKPKPAVSFEKDETVRIIDGPFRHFVGTVEEVNEERGKLKIMVAIFGRLTPIELDFFQVEKM
ncbi:MAG: transcription termination/antitermination protein NusG [Elusimicrobiota bacterium]|nr:transcription termination/antitermination protein NusG [Elusimicrobiota bacterium]